jgi:hypothetical protein
MADDGMAVARGVGIGRRKRSKTNRRTDERSSGRSFDVLSGLGCGFDGHNPAGGEQALHGSTKSQHSAALRAGDGFTIEHRSYRIDDDQDRPVCKIQLSICWSSAVLAISPSRSAVVSQVASRSGKMSVQIAVQFQASLSFAIRADARARAAPTPATQVSHPKWSNNWPSTAPPARPPKK